MDRNIAVMPNSRRSKKAEPHVTGSGSRETLRHDGTHWLVSPATPLHYRAGLGLVPALDKAIAIIEYVNRADDDGATLVNIATALGISKSHCHSILKTLQEHGWFRFDENAKSYSLHAGLLGSVSKLLGIPAIDIIRRELSGLVSEVRFPCVVSQPMADDSFMLVDKFYDPLRMEVSLPIGFRYPKDASAQMRAFLAWAPETHVNAWLANWSPVQYTPTTPMTPKAIRDELAETRKRGYARSRGEFTDGLMALALPIFDRRGIVEFVVNCSAPIDAMSPVERDVAVAMQGAVSRIHQQTLGKFPAGFPSADDRGPI